MYPLALRGITVCGTDSVHAPIVLREQAWAALARADDGSTDDAREAEMRKVATIFAANGAVGAACVEGFLQHDEFDVRILVRSGGSEKSSSGIGTPDAGMKRERWEHWRSRGVELREADMMNHASLIPALTGTDYLVSCAPITATESQYPLIWAAKEAGVGRFVPSEYGFIYDWERSLPTHTVHRTIARQKVFVRQVIELAGLDYTIIPAGLWPEYYMMEPVPVMGDPDKPVAWSIASDIGRIIPHILTHPASRNAVCPIAATAYCSWNELLAVRERLLGRKVSRQQRTKTEWQTCYAARDNGLEQVLMAMGISVSECPDGLALWGNWNATYLPDFKGTPLEDAFPTIIEPFAAQMQHVLSKS
tara:strand:+ start:166 stop:1254 length:1089 start_codon:yes stop_codon:yes gene_type:complete